MNGAALISTINFFHTQKTIRLLTTKKMSNAHKKRAAIEPIINQVKSDHRLNHHFYKGIVGDHFNRMLALAVFNFKRKIHKWKSSFWHFLQKIFILIFCFLLIRKKE